MKRIFTYLFLLLVVSFTVSDVFAQDWQPFRKNLTYNYSVDGYYPAIADTSKYLAQKGKYLVSVMFKASPIPNSSDSLMSFLNDEHYAGFDNQGKTTSTNLIFGRRHIKKANGNYTIEYGNYSSSGNYDSWMFSGNHTIGKVGLIKYDKIFNTYTNVPITSKKLVSVLGEEDSIIEMKSAPNGRPVILSKKHGLVAFNLGYYTGELSGPLPFSNGTSPFNYALYGIEELNLGKRRPQVEDFKPIQVNDEFQVFEATDFNYFLRIPGPNGSTICQPTIGKSSILKRYRCKSVFNDSVVWEVTQVELAGNQIPDSVYGPASSNIATQVYKLNPSTQILKSGIRTPPQSEYESHFLFTSDNGLAFIVNCSMVIDLPLINRFFFKFQPIVDTANFFGDNFFLSTANNPNAWSVPCSTNTSYDLKYKIPLYVKTGNVEFGTPVVRTSVSTSPAHPTKGSKISPNPSSDFFEVFNAQYLKSIQVFDLSGKVRASFQAEPFKKYHISNLANGMYLVHLQFSDGSTESQRLIKRD